ncbi:NAD-dependent epimerase/dehydratase family protein [Bremerella sp. P1]|uniref:NAD-dependent epimerase/dehydratase family protein n=1 Tax=Bremerella sp. P1 TaxID=3026424 RepID=UPI002367826A|nr:NAD-dependent epimerase/dehydratase family protein [Bremerella sp. P1]WDI44640.1 NAD-dependent epimerase/dehydratase family protein [Bremerella sp. P1]
MLALVTGSTGLVGNNVTRMLLEQGHQVRVMVRDPRIDRSLAGLDVEPVPGDIREEEAVNTAMIGVDAVIHSAAVVHIGWTKEKLMQQVNVEGTKIVAQAAMKQGVRMVHVSSVDALGVGKKDASANEDSPREGKIPCPYVLTKRAAEDALREMVPQGLNVVITNPALMFGPWDWKPSSGRMLISVVKKQPPMAPRGGGSTCDVRDVAAAIITAIHKGKVGENYILGGENLTYFDLWKRMAAITGRRPPWARLGPLIGIIAGMSGDLYGHMDGKEPEVNSAAIKMGSQYHYYRSDKAMEELDYQVRPLDRTLRDALLWFRANGYLPALDGSEE